MAGKIIADIIEAPYDRISLNVGNTTVATMNASGLYTSTGNLVITQASQIATTAIANSAVTQAKLASNVVGTGPTFSAIANAGTSLGPNTSTKVNFQSEQWDTNNSYDTSTSRFTPNVAGYYQISSSIRADITSNGVLHIYFRKNGSEVYVGNFIGVTSSQCATTGSCLIYLNGTTDFVDIAVFSGTSGTSLNNYQSSFQGCLVRAA
jgi:hypothetical protein